MKPVRKFVVAAALIGLLAAGTVAPTEAGGKKGDGGDTTAAQCTYLLSVISYPYVSPTIQAWAISLYTTLGCQP